MKVKIDGKSLIIELDDELIGKESSLIISKNAIKDLDNNCLEELRIDKISGIDKQIAFVKTENELKQHINERQVDFIKLQNDIQISSNTDILIRGKVTIDGSNGEEEFKLYNILKNAKQILISSDEVKFKNIDLENLYINVSNKENVTLQNMKISLKENDISNSSIKIYKSTINCKDLRLSSNKSGIEVTAGTLSDVSSKRATIIIDGYLYNEKTDEDKNYKPSIILENRVKDIDTNILNKIILKNEQNNIENIYKIESDKNNTTDDKYYEYYYKNQIESYI